MKQSSMKHLLQPSIPYFDYFDSLLWSALA